MAELSILHPRVLPRVVQEIDVQDDLMGLSLVSTESDTQPFWEYDIVIADRDKLESYQAPNTEARLLDQLPVGHMEGSYAYTRVKKMFSPTTLRLLRRVGEGTASTSVGEDRVIAEMEDMRLKLDRQKEYAVWQMIQGSWSFKVESGHQYTIDYKIPAAHKVTPSVVWGANSDTPVLDVSAIKRIVSHNSGRQLTAGYMNNKTLTRMYELDELSEFLSDRQKELYTNERTIARWNGIDWREYDGGYVSGGVYNTYIPDNKIILFPDGRNPFVLKYGPSLDHDAPADWTGLFTKSWIEPDPSNRQVLMEEQYMPVLLNPLQVAILDIGTAP